MKNYHNDTELKQVKKRFQMYSHTSTQVEPIQAVHRELNCVRVMEEGTPMYPILNTITLLQQTANVNQGEAGKGGRVGASGDQAARSVNTCTV